eukprot:5813992-Pleurochrysis_carterae.AAC.1
MNASYRRSCARTREERSRGFPGRDDQSGGGCAYVRAHTCTRGRKHARTQVSKHTRIHPRTRACTSPH